MKKIIVDNFKYKYPLKEELALKGISFEVEEGEFIGVIGRNGAGKSTLCQALIGLVPQFYKGACGGSIIIDGLNTRKSSIAEISSKVGLVFQNPFNQISGAKLTVYEEIAFGLENNGVPRDEIIKRVNEVIELLNLEDVKDNNPFELSGGQMQRMAIAGVIAMKPDIIVLDEPTSQLDPEGSIEVLRAVQTLSNQGMTVILVEHKVEKLAEYADRILFLDNGEIVDFDTPEKIFSRDDIEKRGVQLPAFTKICRELNLRNKDTGLFPVTLEDAYNLVVNCNE